MKSLEQLKNEKMQAEGAANKYLEYIKYKEDVDLIVTDEEFEELTSLISKLRTAHNAYFHDSRYGEQPVKNEFTLEDIHKALSYGYHAKCDELKGIPSSGYATRFLESLKKEEDGI